MVKKNKNRKPTLKPWQTTQKINTMSEEVRKMFCCKFKKNYVSVNLKRSINVFAINISLILHFFKKKNNFCLCFECKEKMIKNGKQKITYNSATK